MKTFRILSAFAAFSMLLASCNGTLDPDNGGGKDKEENKVVQGEKITSIYQQKMVAMQFTSVGCVNCPNLATSIKSVQANHGGKIIPVAFHMNYGDANPDPMALTQCGNFYKRVMFEDDQSGLELPMLALNFRKGSQKIVSQEAKILSEMAYQAEEYPASTGVAISTTYDNSSRKLEVTARFISEVTQSAKYHIILVEDGIKYEQTGAESAEYTHDNVFRYISSESLKGTDLNLGKPLKPGLAYEVTETVTLKKEWNPVAMRVVAVMLTPDDPAGKNFGCNNANECAVGASVDYVLAEDDSAVESRFERNVCVMEFTGQWCSYCPDGAQLLEFLISDIYPGQVHALAFHNDDEFAIAAEADLRKKFEIVDFPAYLTDMRESGSLSGSGCRLSIETALYESQTHSSVAIASQVTDGVCKVDAKLFSEKSMEYCMAAYAVEDKVVAWQTMSGNSKKEDYVHRHVVRKLISESISGDALGVVSADQEKEHSYEFNVDSSWNLENMSVVVLAIDKYGHVNNAAQCSLNGGSVEYEMKK